MQIFVILITVLLSSFLFSTNINTVNRLSFSQDSLQLDSLDSIYLRESDYTCIRYYDNYGFQFSVACSITKHKADSILATRRKILRERKYIRVTKDKWISKEEFERLFNKFKIKK